MIVEMERMVSRPFSSALLEIRQADDSDSKKEPPDIRRRKKVFKTDVYKLIFLLQLLQCSIGIYYIYIMSGFFAQLTKSAELVEWFKWHLSIHPAVNFGCKFCNRKAYSISSGIMVMPHVNSDQKQKITTYFQAQYVSFKKTADLSPEASNAFKLPLF
jgi:hypothetical protein